MKNFKTFFLTVLLICLLSMSIILCACNPDDDNNGEQQSGEATSGNIENVEPYTLALTQHYSKDKNPYITDYFDTKEKLNLAEKISSLSALKTFCQDKQLQVFDNNSALKNDSVCKKLNSYDEDFFKSHSIILIFRFEETANFYLYDSLSIKDNVMTVNFVSANGNTTTNERTSIRIFEINKDVEKQTQQIIVKESLSQFDQNLNMKIYEDENINTKKDALTSFIINTYEELLEFCDEETSPFFEKDDFLNNEEFNYMYNKNMIELLKKYDEKYFESNSLTLIFRHRGSNSFYKVKDFSIADNSLNLTLSTAKLNGAIPIEESLYCLYLFELDKDAVANVTQFNITETEE